MYCIVIELIRSAIAIQITKNNITIEKISSDAHPANPIGFAPPLEEELNFEEEDDVPDG